MIKYGGLLNMDSLYTEDDTFNKLIQSPIHIVDKELLNIFDPTAQFFNVYDIHEISNLTINDKLLLDIVLKQHHWDLKDYLNNSVIKWVL